MPERVKVMQWADDWRRRSVAFEVIDIVRMLRQSADASRNADPHWSVTVSAVANLIETRNKEKW